MGYVTEALLYYGLPDVASSDKHAVFLPFVASRLLLPQNVVFLYSIKLVFLSV